MLVLGRGIGEIIIVGDSEFTITVLDIVKKKVKLGFNAPKELAIYREEVYRRIKEKQTENGIIVCPPK